MTKVTSLGYSLFCHQNSLFNVNNDILILNHKQTKDNVIIKQLDLFLSVYWYLKNNIIIVSTT